MSDVLSQAEIDALLNALDKKKENTASIREILLQYCIDFYRNIDRNTLDRVLRNYFR